MRQLPKQMKSNNHCRHSQEPSFTLYIKLTFVHKAKNKEMRRCASENDIDETLWIVGLATLAVSFSEIVDSKT